MNIGLEHRRILATALLVAGLSMQAPAQAAVVFTDNFDTDSASTVLNFTAFNNWTVSNGTVDYIRSGGFGINCVGGAGGCVDLDGSTSDAGRLTSNTLFSFDAGVTYTLSALVSGNQRGGATDSFTIGVIGPPGFTFTLNGISSGAPFTPLGGAFSNASAFTARIFIETAGGDNFGPILDNVVLSDNRTTQLPEPGTLGLLACTLAGLAVSRRKAN